jgi:hypothetical protein
MKPTSEPNVPLDCRSCGACCFSGSPTYVPVTGADWQRLGPLAEMYAHFIGHRAFMRMEEDHCAALEMRLRPDGTTEFSCNVYDRRPEICRELERGSPQCEAERARKLAEVRMVVARLDCPREPAV